MAVFVLRVNGREHRVDGDASDSLLAVLRDIKTNVGIFFLYRPLDQVDIRFVVFDEQDTAGMVWHMDTGLRIGQIYYFLLRL